MTDIDTMLAEVKRMDAEATPGEWQWFGNTKGYSCYLATVHSGHIFVLDFARWGMSEAQPRFRWPVGANCGIMYNLAKLPAECGPRFECEYRRDFVGINHPDAQLIAYYRTAAPALAAEVERLTRELVEAKALLKRCEGVINELHEESPEQCACPMCVNANTTLYNIAAALKGTDHE